MSALVVFVSFILNVAVPLLFVVVLYVVFPIFSWIWVFFIGFLWLSLSETWYFLFLLLDLNVLFFAFIFGVAFLMIIFVVFCVALCVSFPV